MKKTLYILSALLLGLVSCNKAEFDTQVKPKDSGLVAVTLSVQMPVELQARTRADGECSEAPNIDNMYVAVFGTSGYPQAYTLAEPITSSTNEAPGPYANQDNRTFYFKVLLPVYEGEAHVHIIANGPETIDFAEQNEETIMSVMRTQDNVGAFWARVILPDGILTQVSSDGIMQTDDDGNYIPSEETAHLFEDLVLVRNFAEVVLLNEATNLYDVRWTLVHTPDFGSVAPMAAGTYVDDYKDYTFDKTTRTMVKGSTTYNGFMFSDDTIGGETIPTADEITTSIDSPLFLYERVQPTENATCILMKARFGSATAAYSYYRLDLMDDQGYFPIYRNYKYQVKIHKVGNKGASTPGEAMNRDSGGNVSQTLEAQSLTDISDGSSRLFVEYVEKNFVKGGKKTKGLYIQYIPNVLLDADHDDFADVDNTSIEVAVVEGGTALKDGTTVTLNTTASADGPSSDDYYFYDFELNEPDPNRDLETVLKVTANNGVSGEDNSTLFRTITIRVLKIMNMTLALEPPKVDALGDKTVLKITLPEDLPKSMFPLEFHIEDVNHTLNPTQEDGNGNAITVPVKTSKSIADGTTNSFYFIRTVNYEDYEESNVVCTEFQTIHGTSVTTIYVENEYFNTEHIVLLNDGIYVTPSNLTVPYDQTSVTVDVLVYDETKTWTVTGGTGVTVSPASGTGSGSFTMTFAENTEGLTPLTRTATVVSGSDSQTVTITQDYLDFAVTPASQTVAFNATSAPIKVSSNAGTWTATVNNGAKLAIGSGTPSTTLSGEGIQNVNVVFDANTGAQRVFTITVTHDDSAVTKTVEVTQRRAPNTSMHFVPSTFGYNSSNRSGAANSTDGYVSVSLGNLNNAGNATSNGYMEMGYTTGTIFTSANRGSITITPAEGFKITKITVTYTNSNNAGYDFSSSGASATASPGNFRRDSGTSSTATWTPANATAGTSAVTITNGYWHQTFQGYNYPRITDIYVE